MKARQKALLRAKKCSNNDDIPGSAMVGGTADPADDFASERQVVI